MRLRGLMRLAFACIGVVAGYATVVCGLGVLVFDDPLHDWPWWQAVLLWILSFFANKLIGPPIVAWIRKEKK